MSCDLPKVRDQATGEIVTWRETDTLPEILFTLPDGLAIASYTITLILRRPDGTLETVAATDLGGSNGKFTFLTTSLQAGENQRAEIHRDDGAGELLTYPPFCIDVDSRVGL